jgi:hypothetical protein
MLESHGDYRAEAPLESHIGGPLYSQQASLPRLPIPSLKETMDRFLPTALPLAKDEEEKTSLIKAAEGFVSEAAELQKRLEGRREEMKDSSWLQLWWNTLGYLQVSFVLHLARELTISCIADQGRFNSEVAVTVLYPFR